MSISRVKSPASVEWRLWRLSRLSDRMASISELLPRLWTLSEGERRLRRLMGFMVASPDRGNTRGGREEEEEMEVSSISGVPSCITPGVPGDTGVISFVASLLVRI